MELLLHYIRKINNMDKILMSTRSYSFFYVNQGKLIRRECLPDRPLAPSPSRCNLAHTIETENLDLWNSFNNIINRYHRQPC